MQQYQLQPVILYINNYNLFMHLMHEVQYIIAIQELEVITIFSS